MTEEEVKVEPSFLEQVKAEREALEKVRDENRKILDETKQMRAVDILSGKVEQPSQEPKKEITPEEYAQAALRGIILK